jgi:phosphoketolase
MTPEPLHLRLSEGDVRTLDRYWRPAHYLAAGQVT